ncbi:kynureninase [Natronospira proteinivora]|uniref:Kynureninase n=1 Tax=Natronospira proteinivora TaxID=1807133 RepID=A0ABT1G7Z5_9GAMM|nr:kynureninase [Natronospira proteinivora]MCP1727436.1 kynureninase [Natronospira proteinivora]
MNTTTFSLDNARALDQADPLSQWRDEFHIPPAPDGGDSLYFTGNSLGLQPRRVARYLQEELDDWARLGVQGHTEARRPWMPYHENFTELNAALVGAKPHEVVQMNSLTVNLHLMMVSFYRPTAERPAILIEKPAFPSDRHAAASQIRFHGFDPDRDLIEITPREGEAHIRPDDLMNLIKAEGHRIALVLLPGVQYYSGQVFDMATITEAAQAKGAKVGFDLAHAAGNIPLHLHDWGVDFAAWCSYKYLNGGPGAIAGCFVHERHARNESLPRFAGWWGHDKSSRFKMGPEFHPIPGAEGWQLSNPPILSMTPVLASLEIFHEVGMNALREKSLKLSDTLWAWLEERLPERVDVITPREDKQRGCQLSLRLKQGNGREVFEELERNGVICDWREPDVIRVAPVPLYNRFEDLYHFVERLEAAIKG